MAAAGPRNHPNIAGVAGEAEGECRSSVVKVKVTGGDAGCGDWPDKRNREVQGKEFMRSAVSRIFRCREMFGDSPVSFGKLQTVISYTPVFFRALPPLP